MSTDTTRKASSPLRDALRLFFRNKPAVVALGMILLLTFSAVSGQLFVGKIPTTDQSKLIEKAAISGDKLDLDVNARALLDHSKTQLKDTFLPPLSSSREIEGKFYWLGTDDLGHDVLARLWSGSSISLTIGFLAVGISLLLGVALGGIAGYFGRSRVRLPLLASLLLVGVGGILWAAEFELAALPLFIIAATLFGVQAVMAILGGRYKSVAAFVAVLLLLLVVRAYTTSVESNTPEGRTYNSAAALADQSYTLVRFIRDLGAEAKRAEDAESGATSEDDRRIAQVELETLQLKLVAAVANHDLLVHNANLEIAKRGLMEREDRIAHLREVGLPEDAKSLETVQASEHKRVEDLTAKTAELEAAVTKSEEAAAKGALTKASDVVLQGSNQLLERRAALRKASVDKYRAERDNRFEALVKGKMMDGTTRYSVYRVFRHFLTAVLLYLLLIITGLMVAADGQASAAESSNFLRVLFVPTISVDDLVMRFTEIMLTIPVIFLILMVLALFERDVYIVMAVIGLTSWMGTTRFVRAEILSLREQDFVQAARALGVSDFRIIWRHLVPNAISPVLVSATIGVAGAVLAESTLSFLGIGAGPDQDTWGKLLADGRLFLFDAPWLTWIPGVAILFTVLAFNLLGEGLREAFNPKLRGR